MAALSGKEIVICESASFKVGGWLLLREPYVEVSGHSVDKLLDDDFLCYCVP